MGDDDASRVDGHAQALVEQRGREAQRDICKKKRKLAMMLQNG